MVSITIRNLDDKVKTRLRILAAGHGRSMEEEARLILAGAVEQDLTPERIRDNAAPTLQTSWRCRSEVAAARADAGPALVRVVRQITVQQQKTMEIRPC